MNESFKIGNKLITFYKGILDNENCLAYSEEISGKNFLFYSQTNHNLPTNLKQAEECIESLSWDIDEENEFHEE